MISDNQILLYYFLLRWNERTDFDLLLWASFASPLYFISSCFVHTVSHLISITLRILKVILVIGFYIYITLFKGSKNRTIPFELS